MAKMCVKSYSLQMSMDTITPNDLHIFSGVIQDFTIFTEVSLWSEKCSQTQLERYEDCLIRMEDKEPKMSLDELKSFTMWSHTKE
jgi:hypothetical protein